MNGAPVAYAGLALAVIACGVGSLRWLRIAQREHYLAGMVTVFARRWWVCSPANWFVLAAGLVGAAVSAWVVPTALVAGAVGVAAPFGLGLRGRTSKLAPTARMRRLASVLALLVALAIALGAALGGARAACTVGAFTVLFLPLFVDAALVIARPMEARLLRPFVAQASRRLQSVAPRVVAITGSYGKTTTKGYVAHLVSGRWSTVATPASFNNTAGLARAVNEHLSAGTGVFVAEMGTYGRGEIASMCSWVVPEVAMITAIGPVHLERMKSLENIAKAKSEILARAPIAVLNVDYPLLRELADAAEASAKTVWRCSSDVAVDEEGPGGRLGRPADVRAYWEDRSGPEPKLRVRAAVGDAVLDAIVAVAPEVEPGNVACAVAGALSLGVPVEVVEARLASLPAAPHRRAPHTAPSGVVVVDDTYNSNPAGASSALELLSTLGTDGGKRAVVSPGMVELGRLQASENARFAATAAGVASFLVVVGRTNARALVSGARSANLSYVRVRDREQAVGWVSANLGPGDAVLYENDLPDHYP